MEEQRGRRGKCSGHRAGEAGGESGRLGAARATERRGAAYSIRIDSVSVTVM